MYITRDIEQIGYFDVIVAGGGPAGICARELDVKRIQEILAERGIDLFS